MIVYVQMQYPGEKNFIRNLDLMGLPRKKTSHPNVVEVYLLFLTFSFK